MNNLLETLKAHEEVDTHSEITLESVSFKTNSNRDNFPSLEIMLHKNNELKEKFNNLYELYVIQKEIKNSKVVDYRYAQEVFTMLPLMMQKEKAKVTTTPSVMNKELIDSIVSKELENADLSDIKEKVDYYLELINEYEVELSQSYRALLIHVKKYLILFEKHKRLNTHLNVRKEVDGEIHYESISLVNTYLNELMYANTDEGLRASLSLLAQIDFNNFSTFFDINVYENTLEDLYVKFKEFLKILEEEDKTIESFREIAHGIDNYDTAHIEVINEIQSRLDKVAQALNLFKNVDLWMKEHEEDLIKLEKFLEAM